MKPFFLILAACSLLAAVPQRAPASRAAAAAAEVLAYSALAPQDAPPVFTPMLPKLDAPPADYGPEPERAIGPPSDHGPVLVKKDRPRPVQIGFLGGDGCDACATWWDKALTDLKPLGWVMGREETAQIRYGDVGSDAWARKLYHFRRDTIPKIVLLIDGKAVWSMTKPPEPLTVASLAVAEAKQRHRSFLEE